MPNLIELETKRLKLRAWRDDDLSYFARLNADPEVMRCFPHILSRRESDAMALRINALIEERGWGLWAVEEKASGQFIGFVGLHEGMPELPFSPCVEIGWRISKHYWGKGYATEAGFAVLEFAFSSLQLPEVCSFTTLSNARSRAVMERLHMENAHHDFEHPSVPEGHILREHVVYKLSNSHWEQSVAAVKNEKLIR